MSKNKNMDKSKKSIVIFSGIAVVLLAVALIIVFNGKNKGENEIGSPVSSTAADLVIPKAEITETAKFYPLKVEDTNMEVLAVKASDGSVRTAFNTCQVCNGSPRAYYKQQGDVLVCQNCGNRFKMDMVEQQRGGCNPVPIMKDEKTDDGINITIPKDLIEKNKELFTSNWKTQ
ncbi:DUF2318 domain-containing protein [Pseudobacteroides cellulosolvens]|uniref:Membrane iron-sulfur containing protein FtrD-like domain-containing protein n=1 Tax=Pseudobacteroides cellulosolvens ATCC 35603 = DSM 2933 TaxID=398512 RepID=A0A0L6JQG9_9FIRM|nr:DUF2318 domain-containing protein [Pseudobacteroides cellulosolvens]KNY28086.1 Protein of unknown function DUF2318, membrane [Pseudobacteroides cellulosolvens ATCC 35603 = DSM 2933]